MAKAAKAILTYMLTTQMVFCTDVICCWCLDTGILSVFALSALPNICTVQTNSSVSFYKASAAKLMKRKLMMKSVSPLTVLCIECLSVTYLNTQLLLSSRALIQIP